MQIPGIDSVHELHIWRLDQQKAVASAHVVVSDPDLVRFMDKAKTISECLHAYGIHSVTLQPEYTLHPCFEAVDLEGSSSLERSRQSSLGSTCQILCGKGECEGLACCTSAEVDKSAS